jgi:hypothetical protein
MATKLGWQREFEDPDWIAEWPQADDASTVESGGRTMQNDEIEELFSDTIETFPAEHRANAAHCSARRSATNDWSGCIQDRLGDGRRKRGLGAPSVSWRRPGFGRGSIALPAHRKFPARNELFYWRIIGFRRRLALSSLRYWLLSVMRTPVSAPAHSHREQRHAATPYQTNHATQGPLGSTS